MGRDAPHIKRIWIAAEFRAAMAALGINNITLANDLGVDRNAVSAWRSESGKRRRPVPNIVAAYMKLRLREFAFEQSLAQWSDDRIREMLKTGKRPTLKFLPSP